MCKIEQEDIRGYDLDGNIICPDCFKNGEEELIETADNILTEGSFDESAYYFCDRCGTKIY